MQSHSRVVVIGGGAVGVNILYSLTRRGWSDVVLLEQHELTSGSTWHAAGLLPLYSHSYTQGRVILKTIEIYSGLETDTGQAVGFHKCGSLRLASDAERLDEYRWHAGCAKTQGIEAQILRPEEIGKLWPLIENGERIVGGLYHPQDGHIAPADVTQALAKGARARGANIYRSMTAIGFEQMLNREWKVKTQQGDITCEHLVVATGFYAQRTARMLGIPSPAVPVVHQYLITDEIPELTARKRANLPEMPILKDDRFLGYLREERQGLMFGPYEAPEDLELFAVDEVPEWFGAMSLLPQNIDPVMHQLDTAMKLVPALARAGVRSYVRGPICTTPDNLPLVGPAPGLRNVWLAEGVSGGIVMGGGLGHYLSEMIVEGEFSIDFVCYDPRRYGDHVNKSYACIKSREAFGNNIGIHFPDYEWPAARPSKTPPCYERLKAHRAVFGALNGWEVPMWFAPDGVDPIDRYSYRRTNYYEHVGHEVRAVRNAVGLIEMTPMTKFEVEGQGAAHWLDRLLANRLPSRFGSIRLCHLLSERGGVRCEFIVVRMGENNFYMISSPRTESINFDILFGLLPEDGSVHLRNVTLERAGFTLVGPKARHCLQGITSVDLSNERFPWLTAQTGVVGLASDVRMLRINFEGELGWELYSPFCYQLSLLDALAQAGREHGLQLIGYRAIDSLRIEKSYANIGRDLNTEFTAWESGLNRFIALDKGDFIGRDALLRQRNIGIARRLVTLKIFTAEGAQALGNEAVYCGNELVGRVTSANHGHFLGISIGLAYVDINVSKPGNKLELTVFNERVPAEVIEDSPYDPQHLRSRM